MAHSSYTTEELLQGLKTLPQELYDMIRDRTFAYDFNAGSRIIEKDYKPPVQLQIDRKIRAEFAEKYYGDKTSRWRVRAGDTPSTAVASGYYIIDDLPLSTKLLEEWLSALSDDVLSAVTMDWVPSKWRPGAYFGRFRFAGDDEGLYCVIFARESGTKSFKRMAIVRD